MGVGFLTTAIGWGQMATLLILLGLYIWVRFCLSCYFSDDMAPIPYWLICSCWIVANILDAHSTILFIGRGIQEGNPIVNFFIRNFGVIPGLVIFKAIFCTLVARIFPNLILASWTIVVFFVALANYFLT